MLYSGKLIIVACVVFMTVGQILFKQVAINYNKTGNLVDWGVFGILLVAGILYLISTGLWIWALRYVEISRAYPYFALGFVFVPLLGAWMFDEVLNFKYAIGVCLIIIGVILTSTQQ
jgi:drug/metabolite transporter (DMT)-like permease